MKSRLVNRVYNSRCFQCARKRTRLCASMCVCVLGLPLDYISCPLAAPGVMETMELHAAQPPMTLLGHFQSLTQFHGMYEAQLCGCPLMPAGARCRNSIIQYSLCPTFMIIFMDLVLHTPPSWLSMPSMVPLDVAADREREREGGGQG